MPDLKCLTRECLVQKLGNLLGATESMESVLLSRLAPIELSERQHEQRTQVKQILGTSLTYPQAPGAQAAILNAMLGGTFPQTFCVANESRLRQLQPWPKAVVLRDLCRNFDSMGITSAELLSIAFQLMWTLAALVKAFPGFQHNSLGVSVKLYAYGSRCYRLKDSAVAYYIPAGFPLPVITSWSTCNSTSVSELPFRTEESNEALDVNDMLDAMLGTISRTMTPRLFKPILDIKSFCMRSCVPQILKPQCPHSFETRGGECRRCIDSDSRQSAFKDLTQSSVCANTTDTIQTTLIVSTFFDDFLEPIKTSQIAMVESF